MEKLIMERKQRDRSFQRSNRDNSSSAEFVNLRFKHGNSKRFCSNSQQRLKNPSLEYIHIPKKDEDVQRFHKDVRLNKSISMGDEQENRNFVDFCSPIQVLNKVKKNDFPDSYNDQYDSSMFMRNEIRNIYKKRAIDSRLNMLGDSYETSSINAYQSNIDQSSKHHSHLETIINNCIDKKRERNLRENIALSARLELALNKNKNLKDHNKSSIFQDTNSLNSHSGDMKKKSCPIDTSTRMSMMDFQNQSQFIENPNFSSSACSSSNCVDEISNRSITGVRLSPIIKKENRMLSKVLDSFDSGQSMRDEKNHFEQRRSQIRVPIKKSSKILYNLNLKRFDKNEKVNRPEFTNKNYDPAKSLKLKFDRNIFAMNRYKSRTSPFRKLRIISICIVNFLLLLKIARNNKRNTKRNYLKLADFDRINDDFTSQKLSVFNASAGVLRKWYYICFSNIFTGIINNDDLDLDYTKSKSNSSTLKLKLNKCFAIARGLLRSELFSHKCPSFFKLFLQSNFENRCVIPEEYCPEFVKQRINVDDQQCVFNILIESTDKQCPCYSSISNGKCCKLSFLRTYFILIKVLVEKVLLCKEISGIKLSDQNITNFRAVASIIYYAIRESLIELSPAKYSNNDVKIIGVYPKDLKFVSLDIEDPVSCKVFSVSKMGFILEKETSRFISLKCTIQNWIKDLNTFVNN